MKENPLLKLRAFGQSIWIDYIRRQMISSGELKRLIEEDGLLGVTSNPAIFDKAIAGSHDYDDAIRALALEGKSREEIYRTLTVEDIRQAADLFRQAYERLDGSDGLVSLEVSPRLAHDTEATVAEARQLWAALNRPNVMIKVPATVEGLPAIRQLISEGINVNVTLLFGLRRYQEVAEAYRTGLETRAARGEPLHRIASVASFFLSRIDVLVDPILEKREMEGGFKAEIAQALRGQIAIASAKSAYQIYRKIFSGEGFQKLVARGARPQRLLWASTGTKNPAYSDVTYVEPLIGPETVNTMPLETIHAYRDHGEPALRLEENAEEAPKAFSRLSGLGIDSDSVTQQLEDEGVQKFIVPFDSLLATIEAKRGSALGEPVDRQSLSLGSYEGAIRKGITRLEAKNFCTLLWRKDPGLWKKDFKSHEIIRNALGWLHVAEKMEENLNDLSSFVSEVKAGGLRHVVHMGMGGSSLAPLVLQRTFLQAKDGLPLTVLDSTHPATILQVEKAVPLKETLFIAASKSGTTAENAAFFEYFFAKVAAIKGSLAGENFIAITDPDTPLVKLALDRGFRRVFLNFADIGGRYSALSYFGLLPAALMGLNVSELLVRSLRMLHACSSCVEAKENPGVILGAVMGQLARSGRDKVTFLIPESIAPLGMWLEQLLAESTGKEGKGIFPVAGEPPGSPSAYGEDRLFVHIRLKNEADGVMEGSIAALKQAGQPVVSILMDDLLDLGQEFFRWEISTAAAGAILGIDPFDQPNVQESKDNTNRLLAKVRQAGRLPALSPILSEGPLRFYGREKAKDGKECLKAFFSRARSGDYVCLQSYLPETEEITQSLQTVRLRLRDGLRLATTLGYGPRYLHSTGQYHKGGPNKGLFLQLTADVAEDVPIPNAPFTFGTFMEAQALGDLEALRKHRRRVLRIHLGGDIMQGLEALSKAMEEALR
jgi:transaldolase / glucose-6-phosphate isomerase